MSPSDRQHTRSRRRMIRARAEGSPTSALPEDRSPNATLVVVSLVIIGALLLWAAFGVLDRLSMAKAPELIDRSGPPDDTVFTWSELGAASGRCPTCGGKISGRDLVAE